MSRDDMTERGGRKRSPAITAPRPCRRHEKDRSMTIQLLPASQRQKRCWSIWLASTGIVQTPARSRRSGTTGQLRDQRASRLIAARFVHRSPYPGHYPSHLRLPAHARHRWPAVHGAGAGAHSGGSQGGVRRALTEVAACRQLSIGPRSSHRVDEAGHLTAPLTLVPETQRGLPRGPFSAAKHRKALLPAVLRCLRFRNQSPSG